MPTIDTPIESIKRLPGGEEIGTAVILYRGDQVLASQRGPQCETFAGVFQMPGGSVEEHESEVVAARRELREETGLEIETLSFLVYTGGTKVRRGETVRFVTAWYSAQLPLGDLPANPEPHKHSDWKLMPVTDLLKQDEGAHMPGTKTALSLFQYFTR